MERCPKRTYSTSGGKPCRSDPMPVARLTGCIWRYCAGPQRRWAAHPITFADGRQLDAFSKLTFGPFTASHHIDQLLARLYAVRHTRNNWKNQANQPGGEEPLVLLYHLATTYITQHFMDEDINLETVAGACHCSTPKLYFTDAKYLANQYRKQFHRSPREERKAIQPRK